MFFTLESLHFKNIFSYGNSITTIRFDKGLNAIVGKNGSGKSSAFLDTLFFNLFGIPYRDIKIEDIINRTNKKKLYTKSIFKVGNDTFTIERSLSPSEIVIMKNNSPLKLLSSKKLIQDDINAIIGTNYSVFKQIICLAVNNNKPFITLKASEKRDIVDNIFGIKVYANMLKLAKKEITGLKTESQIFQKSILFLERDIKSCMSNLNSYKESLNSFEKERESKVKEISTTIKEKQLQIDNDKILYLKESLDSLSASLSEKPKFLDYYKNASLKKNSLETINSQLLKDVKFFQNTTECSICQSILTEEHRSSHLNELKSKLVENKSEYESLQGKITKLEAKIVSFEALERNYKSVSQEYTKLEYTNKALEREIDNLQSRLSEEKSKQIDFNIPLLEKQLEEKTLELEQNLAMNATVEKNLKVNQDICDILSDKGIKSYFFKNLLPILNTKINFYLDLFELPVRLEFNSLMEESLKHSIKDEEYPYNAFSEGEKKRIDLAILLSFIDTTKAISNWDCNVIFFDELLDNAVDTDGLEKILESIKSLCYKNSEQCVYVITHKLEDMDSFDRRIRIKKEGGFSSIEVLEK